jgi:hypothetical protein
MAKIRLDSDGIAEMLRSQRVEAAVESLGRSVESAVGTPTASGRPINVTTRSRTASGGRLSARPAVDVTLADPAGLAVEAKRGPLARAAASVGLEVRER